MTERGKSQGKKPFFLCTESHNKQTYSQCNLELKQWTISSFASIFNLSDPDLTQLNIKLSQMISNEQNEYQVLGQKN